MDSSKTTVKAVVKKMMDFQKEKDDTLLKTLEEIRSRLALENTRNSDYLQELLFIDDIEFRSMVADYQEQQSECYDSLCETLVDTITTVSTNMSVKEKGAESVDKAE